MKQADAETLDRQIIEKVHVVLGFPFRLKTSIATLPVSLHGFGFPSLACINAGIVLSGLAQDLTHHVPAYRSMAQIMMMDWICKKNGCINPLDGEGLKCDFLHYSGSIPSQWIVAQKVMKVLLLPLQNVDQSMVAEGDVSLVHVLNLCSHHAPQNLKGLNGTSLRSLRLNKIHRLEDAGKWMVNVDGSVAFQVHTLIFDSTWLPAVRKNWVKLAGALRTVWLNHIINGPLDLATSHCV